MGIEFRGSRYVRRVWLGKRTIKDGEAAAIWNVEGEHRQVVGPALERMWFSTIRFLDRFVATSKEYLRVELIDGTIKHVKGPDAIFMNPVYHRSIVVIPAIHLASPQECLVVYTKIKPSAPARALGLEGKNDGRNYPDLGRGEGPEAPLLEAKVEEDLDGKQAASAESKELVEKVTSKIIRGPVMHVPHVDEWLHTFKWTDLNDDKSLSPVSFKVLRTGVRMWKTRTRMTTTDGVHVVVNLMLQFQVANIAAVLTCDNPISALKSLLAADLGEAGAQISSEQLLGSEQRMKVNKLLDDIKTYKRLATRSQCMGIQVISLCLNGIETSRALQAQYEQDVKSQARLRAERSSAAQAHELAALRLESQKKRMVAEQDLSERKLKHSLKLVQQKFSAQATERKQVTGEALSFLEALKSQGVDLTKVLTTGAGASLIGGLLHQKVDEEGVGEGRAKRELSDSGKLAAEVRKERAMKRQHAA